MLRTPWFGCPAPDGRHRVTLDGVDDDGPAADAGARSRRWSDLHHGIDPHGVPLLAGWLRGMWTVARPLAAVGVPPTAVTVTGVALAGSAVLVAPRHPTLAACAVASAALCDGLDGAVAVVGGRATPSGRRADAVADRLCDVAFATVLGRLGAPRWAAASAAGLAVGVDTLRRVRRTPDRITVAERPTFTICTVLAGLSAARGPRQSAAISAGVWIAAGAVGVGQLLRRPPGDPSSAGSRGGAAPPTVR